MSKTAVNSCGGVPIPISPQYWTCKVPISVGKHGQERSTSRQTFDQSSHARSGIAPSTNTHIRRVVQRDVVPPQRGRVHCVSFAQLKCHVAGARREKRRCKRGACQCPHGPAFWWTLSICLRVISESDSAVDEASSKFAQERAISNISSCSAHNARTAGVASGQ